MEQKTKVVNVTKSNILNVDNIKCDMSFILNVLSNSKKKKMSLWDSL